MLHTLALAQPAPSQSAGQRGVGTSRRRRLCPVPQLGARPAARPPAGGRQVLAHELHDRTTSRLRGPGGAGGRRGQRAWAQPPSGTPGKGPGRDGEEEESGGALGDWEWPGGDYDSTENIPGAVSARKAWWSVPPDVQGLLSLFLGFTLLPLVLSTCLRVAIIDPLVYVTLDLDTFELNEHQRMEVFEEVDRSEARLRYDILMRRAPPMSHAEIEERGTAEGRALETAGRVKSRQVVVNSISDSLCFVMLVTGVLVNRKRVTLVRQGVYKKFLRLPPSVQAIAFLLVTDIVVGYHSSDGWITFVEMFYNRYTINGAEENEKFISLFVAVVPVVADVAFKFWVYKYLRKLSPGTQIILGEMDG